MGSYKREGTVVSLRCFLKNSVFSVHPCPAPQAKITLDKTDDKLNDELVSQVDKEVNETIRDKSETTGAGGANEKLRRRIVGWLTSQLQNLDNDGLDGRARRRKFTAFSIESISAEVEIDFNNLAQSSFEFSVEYVAAFVSYTLSLTIDLNDLVGAVKRLASKVFDALAGRTCEVVEDKEICGPPSGIPPGRARRGEPDYPDWARDLDDLSPEERAHVIDGVANQFSGGVLGPRASAWARAMLTE